MRTDQHTGVVAVFQRVRRSAIITQPKMLDRVYVHARAAFFRILVKVEKLPLAIVEGRAAI